MDSDILIVGAGLSGLRLAALLHADGRDVRVVEARNRVGGRILSEIHAAGRYDLGPAWFWPGQPRIAALIAKLGLTQFDQYATGILTFEDERGQVQRGQGFASMQGSYRMAGGLSALTDALASSLPTDRLHLSHPVTHLSNDQTGITATCQPGATITARKVVLALPPRVAAEIAFAPALPFFVKETLRSVPTWMAGQAKAIALYDTPFWRDAGLSGDAMSRHGPMVEVHDASPATGGPAALFGFIGVPPSGRRDEARLRSAILAQLARLFGPKAANPNALLLKDWAFDQFTATERDHQPLFNHPHYGHPPALQHSWDGALLFSGTEMAPEFGGYLEGALEAAEATHAILVREKVESP